MTHNSDRLGSGKTKKRSWVQSQGKDSKRRILYLGYTEKSELREMICIAQKRLLCGARAL